MANQIAIKLHTQPGDEVIIDSLAHPVHAESGGPGLISGVLFQTVQGRRGLFAPEDIEGLIRPDHPLFSRTRLLWLENTHNMGGGTVWPLEQLHSVAAKGRTYGLALHLDGARLMNASVKSGVAPSIIAEPFDTVSFCLTKGLGAPVGGLLAGGKKTIDQARRYKQALGGAMRQSGVLAAAGLYALEHHIDRLADDHRRARQLAEGLADIPGLNVDVDQVETNMVFEPDPHIIDAERFIQEMEAKGVLLSASRGTRVRAVTHLDIDDDDIHRAIEIASSVMSQFN